MDWNGKVQDDSFHSLEILWWRNEIIHTGHSEPWKSRDSKEKLARCKHDDIGSSVDFIINRRSKNELRLEPFISGTQSIISRWETKQLYPVGFPMWAISQKYGQSWSASDPADLIWSFMNFRCKDVLLHKSQPLHHQSCRQSQIYRGHQLPKRETR